MRYYPVNLDVRNRHCLVVGGGRVGERKVKSLLECGAKVMVTTTDATDNLKAMAVEGVVNLELRDYQPSDLDGKFLVIGATDDQKANQRISQDAANRGILCNIVDSPEVCTFVIPAVVRQGDLLIAISTSNKSPAVARRMRQTLEKKFGPEYGVLLNLMGAIRKKLLAESKSPEAHKRSFERLLDEGLVEMIREDRPQDVDNLLERVLGEGYTWNELLNMAQGS
jgi:precorrin-2 dehydrogenase/sirohydrochlorin ferrochelatase